MYLRDLATSQHGVAAIRMSDMTVMGGFACAPIASLVHSLSIVIAGLVPASTPFSLPCRPKTWMPATSTGMTVARQRVQLPRHHREPGHDEARLSPAMSCAFSEPLSQCNRNSPLIALSSAGLISLL